MPEPLRPPPLLALVIPCYNEEEILADSMAVIEQRLAEWKQAQLISPDSFCCYVDDGSTDRTWHILTARGGAYRRLIKLAHNAGHQNALLAGMNSIARDCDCCISLDADLQDDISVIPEMVVNYQNGSEVVYGVRANRSSDSVFKRGFANAYYWLAQKTGVAGIPNHADYRLLSRRALYIICEYREQHLYWRGIIPALNLPSAKVFYTRQARQAGDSKYTIGKMLVLAINGITSFSILPLRFITLLGLIISLVSFYLIVTTLYGYYLGEIKTTQGWLSLILSLYMLGGLIMFSIGIAGEYIGKIFIQSKNRPLYVIEQEENQDDSTVAASAPPPAAPAAHE